MDKRKWSCKRVEGLDPFMVSSYILTLEYEDIDLHTEIPENILEHALDPVGFIFHHLKELNNHLATQLLPLTQPRR